MTVKKSIQKQLVDARENLGFDVNYVQSITGISTVVLEGFEAGNFDVVEPVFSRLALRTYADFLELDVEDLLSDLEMVLGEKDKQNIGNSSKEEKSRDAVGSFPFFWLFIVFSILSATVFFFILFSNTGPQSSSLSPVDNNTESYIANQIGINKSSLEVVKVEDDRMFLTKETDSDLFATPKLLKEDSISSAVVKMTEKERTVSVHSFGDQAENSERSELVSKVALKLDSTSTSSEIHLDMEISQPQNAESLKFSMNTIPIGIEAVARNRSYSDSLSLVLRAVDTTWVRVEWGDGDFFESIMLPEEQKRFSSTDSFFVHAGKPHGIIYYFNGELLTRSEIGEPNRVLRFRADNNSITIIDSKFKPLRTFVKP